MTVIYDLIKFFIRSSLPQSCSNSKKYETLSKRTNFRIIIQKIENKSEDFLLIYFGVIEFLPWEKRFLSPLGPKKALKVVMIMSDQIQK